MELKVVKEDEKMLMLEVKGETIGFVNLLREALWNDKNISEAAYVKEHPYLSEPKVFVKTSRGLPKTALEKAADFILNETKKFREEFKKALKK